ncbi:MAG: head GIN domain-containing protein [Bacteroidales bacterium]
MKNKMNFRYMAYLLLSFLISGSLSTKASGIQEREGIPVRQERDVSSFDALEAGGAFRIFLTQGGQQKVVVEADANYIEDIETSVKAGKLSISTRKNLQDPGEMNIYITFKSLKEIDISGACHLTSENRLKFDNLEVECSGAGKIMLTLAAGHIDLDCSGAGQVELLGSVASMNLELSGAANLDANELEATTLIAEISGASRAAVHVTGELSAEVSGAGNLIYQGDPMLRQSDVSGAASIKKR